MKKNGQAWGFDLAIAVSIFLFGAIFFYFYALNYSSTGDEFKSLYEEGDFIAESLLSDGYPVNWNENNVARIGILSNENINSTKVERFYNLASGNYAHTKSLFNIRSNYYVNFSVPINLSGGTAIQLVGMESASSKNLVSVTRVTSYNGEIVTLKIGVWN